MYFYIFDSPLLTEMIKETGHYNLFFEFIKTYSLKGFRDIDRSDPLILALEELMDYNKQFLSVFDMLHIKTLFVSQGSLKFLGIRPEDLTSFHIKEATHPDDLKRHELGLVKLFKIAHDLFSAKSGEMVISSNFRVRTPDGKYTNQLVQCYFFYSPDPNNTVYLIIVKTDISWSKKIKNGFHFYLGKDISNFRYPDEELLGIGPPFTEREFEIIRLINEGLDSKHIAQKLFISRYTVNTHRKNILDKTGKAHISELIYDLHEQGLL
jgi:DNA-binding CsgD family transcriptional regulator